MPPLSSCVEEDLKSVLDAIKRMRRYRSGTRAKPHKLVLLLSVIDLYESGLMPDGRVYLSEELRKRFVFYFNFVRQPGDLPQIGPPFFHLRTSGIWHHAVRPVRRDTYSNMETPGGGVGNVLKTVEYAYLSDCVMNVLNDPVARERLRREIACMLIDEIKNTKATELLEARYAGSQ